MTLTGEYDSKFWNEQNRLLASQLDHGKKALQAAILAGTVMAFLTPAGILIGLESIHQFYAASLDLKQHNQNKKSHFGLKG